MYDNQPEFQPDGSPNPDFKQTGRLKFFNEGQSYGFILSDSDSKDLFFHYDDMKKTNLSKQFLKDAKNRFIVKFQFKVMGYYGKYNLSKKAVDIELLKIEPIAFPGGLQTQSPVMPYGAPGAGAPAGLEMQFAKMNMYGGGSGQEPSGYSQLGANGLTSTQNL